MPVTITYDFSQVDPNDRNYIRMPWSDSISVVSGDRSSAISVRPGEGKCTKTG